tara:strand:+ start:8182 stop:8565 length:384 start_codon:yes stop_codon:yes gene_type:complete
MSTLKVNTIQDTSSGSSSTPAQIEQGRAKAWVNFNGQGTVAIRDDYNVSTVGDNGTGQYQINFTTGLNNNSYSVVLGGSRDQPEGSRCFPPNVDGMTTAKFDLTTHNDGSTLVDWALVQAAVFGDPA